MLGGEREGGVLGGERVGEYHARGREGGGSTMLGGERVGGVPC